LLIVDAESNVLRKADPSLNMNLHRVTELVRPRH
jgi:hypothetical protein